MKHKVEWCDRKLVTSPYYYCLVLTEKTYHKELDKLNIPDNIRSTWLNSGADATAHFFTHGETNRKICIVCLNDTKKVTDVQKVGLLCHEAIHIWQYIREELGEHNPSKEFEAYSIQTIFEELLYAHGRAKESLASKKKRK